jgi:hypothetical protein
MVGHCVDTIGFIFDKASVKIKHKKEKVPKSSKTSSLTTVCTTYKDKRSSSSESNPYYSSSLYSSSINSSDNISSNSISSISMPCLKSSQFGSCSKSKCSSYSSSLSSCGSSLSSCGSSSLSYCSSSLSSCGSSSLSCSIPSLTLNSENELNTYPTSSSENSKFIITSSKSCSDSLKYKKKYYKNNKSNCKPCIKPICYEPSICGGDDKCKKKCSHKNKKKFKTDIFNKLNKYCLIKLTKENFMSSTLSVCTDNKDDCWVKFTENLYELLGGSFLITFTKCNIFRTLYCQLLKINYCDCCQEIKLFFKYNLLPPKKIEEECYNNINNIDLYYKLENCVYHNLRFYYDREYNFNPRNFINI